MSVASEAAAQAVLSEVNERQQRLVAQAEAVTAFSQVLVDGVEADSDAASVVLGTFYSRLDTLSTAETSELTEHLRAVTKILGGRAVTESEAVAVETVEVEPPIITPNGHETDLYLGLARTNGHNGANDTEVDPELTLSTSGDTAHDTEAADPEAMEEKISEHSAKLLSEFFGEDRFGMLTHMTKAKALIVTNQLAAKLKEINAFRGPVDERLLQMVPALVDGVAWKEIAKTYYKSPTWAYTNHRNAVSSFVSHFSALDRSNMLADFWYGEASVAQSVESELAEIQTELTPVAEPEVVPQVPEPIAETEPETVTPKPYRQEINYDAPTLEVIGQLLGYTEQKYFRALETIFSMDRNQPNQSEQGRQVYQDFASVLDMTADSSRWFDRNGKLEYTVLNAILRGAKDGKSPLSAPSVKGKFGRELGEAGRKFDEVLESALQKFIDIRRQKLESAGSVVAR